MERKRIGKFLKNFFGKRKGNTEKGDTKTQMYRDFRESTGERQRNSLATHQEMNRLRTPR